MLIFYRCFVLENSPKFHKRVHHFERQLELDLPRALLASGVVPSAQAWRVETRSQLDSIIFLEINRFLLLEYGVNCATFA